MNKRFLSCKEALDSIVQSLWLRAPYTIYGMTILYGMTIYSMIYL